MSLSTVILGEKPSTAVNFLDRVRTMQETLADYVRRIRNEKALSTLDVERNSSFKITDGYVSQIENKGVKNVSPEKLKALAKGLGVTEEEIFAIARGKKPNQNVVANERFENLSLKFGGLKPDNQRKAEVLVELLEREIERMANEQN